MGKDEGAVDVLGPIFSAISSDIALALAATGLRPGARVLDVGTGEGFCAIYLASLGYDITTGEPETDLSHYAGRAWKENARKAGVLDRIKFTPFDADTMPFATGSFDAVFFFGVLHHINEDIRRSAAAEAMRVAKSSGAVVFFEPNAKTLSRIRKSDPHHPDACNPNSCIESRNVSQIGGGMMDVYIYRKTAVCPSA